VALQEVVSHHGMRLVLYLPVIMCAVPVDGIKGKTWGPSTLQKERYRPSVSVLGNDRYCKSAPNIQRTLCHLGGHSNIGALQELGKFPVQIRWYIYMCLCFTFMDRQMSENVS